MGLWLIVAPLMTAWLYHGWMHRPAAIMDRWQWHLVPGDLVSGAVVAAVVIVSFLSLMSFADFLRVEWQNQRGLWGQPVGGALAGPAAVAGREGRERGVPRHGAGAAGLGVGGMPWVHPGALEGLPLGTDFQQDNVDESIWEHFQERIVARPSDRSGRALNPRQMAGWDRILDEEYRGHLDDDDDDDDEEEVDSGDPDSVDENSNQIHTDDSVDMSSGEGAGFDTHDEDEDDDSWLDEDSGDVDDEDDDMPPLLPAARGRHPLARQPQVRLNDVRIDAPFDMDAIPPEDVADLDLNIALDELLGVRGPVGAVFRNLLWLLAFNTVYLGLFAFTPRVLGITIISLCFNTTVSVELEDNATTVAEGMSFFDVFKAIDQESERQNTTFRLPDLATVTLGYLSCAMAVLFMRFLWTVSQKVGFFRAGGLRTRLPVGPNQDLDEMRVALDEMHHVVHGMGQDVGQNIPGFGDEPQGIPISVAIGIALDAMVASVKVGVLLFLKMFMLPIILGLCLDASLMPVLGTSLQSQIEAAGNDLFSFILLHWVAGITFMLLVTVSVLQLREVAHPDLLGQMIRPQEPQPDLLGNLMHESVGTHIKRMILSLVIYTALLTMHVYIPIGVLKATGFAHFFPLDLKFWYAIMPQLQIPLELLLFHLCMLALLEKYKNSIGEMQHHWLKFTANQLGLADSLLPRKVQCFRLLGSRPIFLKTRVVDKFWSDVTEPATGGEDMLEVNLDSFAPETMTVEMVGETKPNGDRVLFFGSDFIRLPARLPGRALRTRSFLLPTMSGRFRLNARGHTTNPVIQIWEEVTGEMISRPPEGWDDLGAGGADVQGRWAWGQEKKSAIEGGVAHRSKFFGKQSFEMSVGVLMKLTVVFLLSWIATTVLLCIVLISPVSVGRFIYYLLRVPDKWLHDPLAFLVGLATFYPKVRNIASFALLSNDTVSRRLGRWLRSFHLPSFPKIATLLVTAVVWFGVAPFLLGVIYDVAFLKPPSWFMGQEPWITRKEAFMSWGVGNLLLYFWSSTCQAGISAYTLWMFGADPAHAAAAAPDGVHENANVNPANAQAVDDNANRLQLSWQGENGRVAHFWDVWLAVFLSWEWDKVDSTTLLQDCALPVMVQLFIALFITATYLGAVLHFLPELDWLLLRRIANMLASMYPEQFETLAVAEALVLAGLVRAILVCTIMGQLCRVWHQELGTWFQKVHHTARDDRYLIGQILMNHGGSDESIS